MKLSPHHLATAWYEALTIAEPEQWSAISQRLLRYLYAHGQLKLLPQVVRQVEALEHTQHGTTAVTVRSAHLLPESLLHEVIQQLLPQAQPVIAQLQDDSVIAGVRVETLNQRWDLSLRGQLRQLTQALS
jgi:F0F1-type ATP synthase delta subunit